MPNFDTSPHLGFSFLYAAQAQKDITVNEALLLIDLLLNNGAESRTISTPPTSPLHGRCYIIGQNPTHEWQENEYKITWYHASKGWIFLSPQAGISLWVKDEEVAYTWNGTEWISGLQLKQLGLGGAQANAENVLSINAPSTLLNHQSKGHRLKINKNTATDTSAIVFQTNYIGHAEIGLIANNHLKAKVSPDGASWLDALSVDYSTGAVTFTAPPCLPGGSAAVAALNLKDDKDTGIFQPKEDLLGITTGGIESVRFSVQGISFDQGETYQKYESGVWTPSLYGLEIAGNPTYTYNTGLYFKYGPIVTLIFRLDLSSKGGMKGNIMLSGLPFACRFASYALNGHFLQSTGGMTLTQGQVPIWQVLPGTSTARLSSIGNINGSFTLKDSNINENFNFRLTMTYIT